MEIDWEFINTLEKEEDIAEAVGFNWSNFETERTEIRDKYLLTEIEQDKAIINHLEVLSEHGKIPLSGNTRKYASMDALCGAQFIKTIKVLAKIMIEPMVAR